MYLRHRFYLLLVAVILITGSGFAFAPLFTVGRWLLLVLLVFVVVDVILLWHRSCISASRHVGERFSNGDNNTVTISVESTYPFPVRLEVIDEAPVQFQCRHLSFKFRLPSFDRHFRPLSFFIDHSDHRPQEPHSFSYSLRPTRRGVYGFGHIRVFASTWIGLVERRYTCAAPQDVKVYPSYLQLRQMELTAISQNLQEPGIKRVRRIGNNTEFEHIRDYLRGDDYRTVNWRATARLHRPMVNVYQQERSQQVFAVIDKGRVMQQSFCGMTLLDYSINASLALSYVAMHKEDRAGLITFTSRVETIVAADRRPGHIKTLLETLYAEQTDFGETDFSSLSVAIGRHISKRSLLVLFTNFMGQVSLLRQLPFLQQIARRHRLLVVFFEDTEITDFISRKPLSREEVCQQQVAEKFADEKRLVCATLRQHGILSLLTTPQQLTANTVNRYLAIRTSW
jgi:uncharacterized protein (DUF58 family)